ncbi:unnamed protein product [Effrenium voratum]|uniref:Formamidopyrimidine-DNA glycosylase catalytic domain-containing protein n=2 Tax=Effrenium voratum TaxID=2562239 RepID=A0AA36NE48_9DINO|nr:unnamed protein product [Effrenium voratum]
MRTRVALPSSRLSDLMPELPEVEYSRRCAQRALASKRISAVKVANDRVVFEKVQPKRFAKLMTGRKVKRCRRWGKQLWFEMDKGPCPTLHLGMTGSVHIKGKRGLKYVRLKEEDPNTWPPRFCKLELQMSDGTCFAMSDPRRFGRISCRNDPLHEPPVSRMGFDPLIKMPTAADFAAQLRKRMADIKAVLLDQSFAAGVGNWVADEVLYQAGIHPKERAAKLSPKAVKALHRHLGAVVKRAVKVNADAAKFPRTWLFHYRWALTSSVQGQEEYPGRQRPTLEVPDFWRPHFCICPCCAEAGGGRRQAGPEARGPT